MNELIRYLDERFGLSANADLLSQKRKNTVPLYLQGNFELYDGRLSAGSVIWAKPFQDADVTPNHLKKQATGLKNFLNSPVIFVFDHLDSWQRKRLIEQHIAFAQPPKQIYVPEFLLELNDSIDKKSSPTAPGDYLKPPSQLALLYHLQVAPLAGQSFGEIAQILHLSTMSITRIAKDLQSIGLVEVTGSKEKSLSFPSQGKSLWEKALPFLRSPVRQAGFISKDLPKDVFRMGGEPALAHYTMLTENGEPSNCIGKEAFLALRKTEALPSMLDKHGDHKIEVWHYDPFLLSQGEEVVDRLSLYLTLAQEKDERIIGALNDLINEMRW